MRDFLAKLEPVLGMMDVACLLIDAPDTADEQALEALARPLLPLAQSRNVAVLLANRAALARRLGADGVHLDARKMELDAALRAYHEARRIVGEDGIVGAVCPPERHTAMELAEAGANYVGFDCAGPEGADLIAWWAEMMTTPCIAFGSFGATEARALADSGTDFLAPEAAAWTDDNPSAHFSSLLDAIR